MLTLAVYRGNRLVQELELDGQEVRIGRHADNTLVLPDESKGVSRNHAVLRVENGAYALSDLKSQNGTFVDGARVTHASLFVGQDIVIGPYRLVLQPADALEAETGPMSVIAPPAPVASPLPPAARAEGTASLRNGAASTQRDAGATISKKRPSPLLFVVPVVVLALAFTVFLWRRSANPGTEQAVVESPGPTTTTTVALNVTPPSDPLLERLTAVRTAVEAAEAQTAAPPAGVAPLTAAQYGTAARDLERVLTDVVQPMLSENPTHPELLALQTRITTGISSARQVEKTLVAKTAKPTPPVVRADPDDVRPRPDESPTDYQRRNAEAKKDYAYGERLLQQGDWAAAVAVWGDLEKREGSWRNTVGYAVKAREALAGAAAFAVTEARRLEAAGDLVGAWKELEIAVKYDAPNAAAALESNLERRRLAARNAMKEGRSYANRRDTAEATKRFQQAIGLLPPQDPLRIEAESELKRITG